MKFTFLGYFEYSILAVFFFRDNGIEFQNLGHGIYQNFKYCKCWWIVNK